MRGASTLYVGIPGVNVSGEGRVEHLLLRTHNSLRLQTDKQLPSIRVVLYTRARGVHIVCYTRVQEVYIVSHIMVISYRVSQVDNGDVLWQDKSRYTVIRCVCVCVCV